MDLNYHVRFMRWYWEDDMPPIAKVRHMELVGLGWSLLKNGKYEKPICTTVNKKSTKKSIYIEFNN